ncbi:MAG: NADH-quinone oxidoreductase subunit N [Cytophagaceae bacterium]|nr:NADH-quinone oxidoreductase subunit N [Cytophagaceae bacterium]MDW8457088.1 NADH-quinone oxidoreductase subunit N [Cytophagaceae bacterium]
MSKLKENFNDKKMTAVIILSCLGIVSMLADIFSYKKALWYIVLAGVAGAIVANLNEKSNAIIYDMLLTDNYAIWFSTLILALVLLWFMVSKDQYESGVYNSSDNYALILFATVGALILTSFSDLTMMFLGIEILSIPLFILAGSNKKDVSSNEASLKYFLAGAFASGILLFGITFIYGSTGTFKLDKIADWANAAGSNLPALFYTGILLVMVGLAFKVSAAPFHFWTPDVYQGSPMFVTAFMATIVKGAAFAGFFRLFYTSFTSASGSWALILSILIAATILTGNIIAVYQSSVKRMLAYSSIAQAGYILLTVLLSNQEAKYALLLYIASYGVSTITAFTVLYHVEKIKGTDTFESFTSLSQTHPLLSVVMTIAMLSLAGIPPTIGFFAKFYLFSSVLKSNTSYLWLIMVSVAGSLVSVYYYFRVIIAMYGQHEPIISSEKKQIPAFYNVLLLLLVCVIIILGMMPDVLMSIDNL